jgi:xylono-1,5-lactonase
MRARQRIECIWEAQMELGESTIWVDDEQALYFVDGPQGRLLKYTVSEGTREVYRCPGVIGFVARRIGGGFVAGIDSKLCTLDPTFGTLKEVACPEPHLPNSHFNDGKVDPVGRLWAGTLDRDCTDPVGSLYLIRKDFSWNAIDDGYLCPNGPAFSPNGDIFYHTDSMRRRIYQFDLDLAAGTISNKRMFVEFSQNEGLPDGMTVDREGRVWVAHFGGGRVTAFNPNGRVDDVIAVPVPNVTTCAFGGTNGDTLFVATARTWMSDAQLREAPLAGSLFACEGLAHGIPAFGFNG